MILAKIAANMHGMPVQINLKMNLKPTYSNFLLHQLSSIVDLLVRPSDGEDLDTGVGIRRRVSLQFYSGTWLLADALNGLTPCIKQM